MKRLSFYIITIILVSLFLPVYAFAANGNSTKNEFNPINTGVTSLSITPDSRGASMGDLGVATDPMQTLNSGTLPNMLSLTAKQVYLYRTHRGYANW